MNFFLPVMFCLALCAIGFARGAESNEVSGQLRALGENMAHLDAKLTRQLNELLWYQRLNDVAQIDKVRFTGPPPRDNTGVAPVAGSNEVVVSAFTFLPRQHSRWHNLPLLVLAHGEIHG